MILMHPQGSKRLNYIHGQGCHLSDKTGLLPLRYSDDKPAPSMTLLTSRFIHARLNLKAMQETRDRGREHCGIVSHTSCPPRNDGGAEAEFSKPFGGSVFLSLRWVRMKDLLRGGGLGTQMIAIFWIQGTSHREICRWSENPL